MNSIRKYLLVWLLAALTLGLAAAAAAVYHQARDDANALFDYHLRQVVASLPGQSFPALDVGAGGGADEHTVIQIWDRTGTRLYFSHPSTHMPQRAELGFSTVATPQGPWRVYSAIIGSNVVQAGQPLSVRGELAAGVALRTTLPFLILFPLLGAVIMLTVRGALRPLGRIAAEVGARSAQVLDPVADRDVPEEARPLVRSLNDLLARLDYALDLQRAFVADAAHELRTPLTALKLQIQLAGRAQGEAERARAFAEVDAGLARATRMVEQLLALARQEPAAGQRAFAPCDLADLARDAVSTRALIARERGIDLGVKRSGSVKISGDASALEVMLGNLVDNAIRHTPSGGTVDVESYHEDGFAVLEVADTGPGIPQAERARVFDRFYRLPGSQTMGSGLGLAIVRRVAEAHGARVDLLDREGGGLRVRMRFPAHGEADTNGNKFSPAP